MADDPTMQPDPGGPPTPTGPPAGDPNNAGPPGGGGPILAALSQQRNQPQVSAPGPGNQADAMMKVKSALDLLGNALPSLGAGTPIYTATLNAMRQLSKHVAEGAPTAGVQQTMLQDLLRGTIQRALFSRMMGQRAAQGQEQNPNQPAGPSPQMAQAPMPSMALPGT
jgi:hypothetical protein